MYLYCGIVWCLSGIFPWTVHYPRYGYFPWFRSLHTFSSGLSRLQVNNVHVLTVMCLLQGVLEQVTFKTQHNIQCTSIYQSLYCTNVLYFVYKCRKPQLTNQREVLRGHVIITGTNTKNYSQLLLTERWFSARTAPFSSAAHLLCQIFLLCVSVGWLPSSLFVVWIWLDSELYFCRCSQCKENGNWSVNTRNEKILRNNIWSFLIRMGVCFPFRSHDFHYIIEIFAFDYINLQPQLIIWAINWMSECVLKFYNLHFGMAK